VRRAVWVWGTWFDRQRNATDERDAPKHQRPKVRVPRYSEAQLRAMLGLEPEADGPFHANGHAPPGDDLDELASAFLAGADLEA
jgi:hypothetical protein